MTADPRSAAPSCAFSPAPPRLRSPPARPTIRPRRSPPGAARRRAPTCAAGRSATRSWRPTRTTASPGWSTCARPTRSPCSSTASACLPETDPWFRQIVVSQGTFLEALVLALRERGVAPQVTLFPDGEFAPRALDDRPVARISWSGQAARRPSAIRCSRRCCAATPPRSTTTRRGRSRRRRSTRCAARSSIPAVRFGATVDPAQRGRAAHALLGSVEGRAADAAHGDGKHPPHARRARPRSPATATASALNELAAAPGRRASARSTAARRRPRAAPPTSR